MNKIEEMFSKSRSGTEYAREYVSYLSELLSALDFAAVGKVIEVFQKARAEGSAIFFAGNGGSAATSSHFAEDLACATRREGNELVRAISLADSISYITAIANDEGYENIFVGQMKNLFKKGDVLVAISGSGNSPNVIKAVEYANSHGGISVGITGFDGGKMKDMCRYCVLIRSGKGEYGPVEDAHLVLCHLITTYMMFKASGD